MPAAAPNRASVPVPSRAETVVVGAGLAGLACARRLTEQGIDVLLLEAADAVGGRVRTDRIDGFRCDRGFQLLNPSYPEARRVLDLPSLRLQALPAGLVVASEGGPRLLTDPRRTPPRQWRAALAGALAGGEPGEKLAFARWALRAAAADPANLLAEPDEPWGAALSRRGIDGRLRHEVVEPFLAGTLGERDGVTSHRFVELLVRSFVRGTPAVPWSGMQAIPEQLAATLPEGVLRLGMPVVEVTADRVHTADGTITAQAVVVATDPRSAARLTGLSEPPMRGLTTFWHVAEHAPTQSGALHVDADRRGPVTNTVVISHSAPSYSPDQRALIATTVLGGGCSEDGYADAGARLETAVRGQLQVIYGADTRRWELLATHAIQHALTAMNPPLDPRRPVELDNGLLVAGDHRDTASIQGALVSGRRAADAALRWLGRAVPPRTPLGAGRAR